MQGLNPHLLHWQAGSLPLNLQWSPHIASSSSLKRNKWITYNLELEEVFNHIKWQNAFFYTFCGIIKVEIWSGLEFNWSRIWSFLSQRTGEVKVAQMCLTLQTHQRYSPWYFPGQNTGMGSLSLLQGIFPTQGLNPGLPHCRQILYQLSHKRTGSSILKSVYSKRG